MPIGKIEAFDETNDDCNAYVERIEQYFIANEIKDNKQVAVMLSLMGNKTYGLLRNLAAPAKARLALKEGSQPKFCKARRVPYAMKPKAEVELKRLEKKGILPKVKFSDWATPIVPVAKSNGTVRICGDQKTTVNPQLQTEEYPLPRIDDIFAKLTGGQKFTKIDLRQAYHQMEVEEESQEYLTINTHQELYRYNRLVFGITSAPAIWQRSMDQILEGVEGTNCILDDMIIIGKDDKEHLENLEGVLKRLQANGLRANREKCEFFQTKITYCGHEVHRRGLHKTQEKIHAVGNAPRPENVQQLRSFLGLVNYYHKFLPNLATTLNLQGSSNVNEITKRFSFNLKYVMPLSLFYHCSSVFRDTTSFGWELIFFPISVALRSSFWRSKGFV